MGLFKKEKKIIEVDGKKIELQQKPGLLGKQQKPEVQTPTLKIPESPKPFIISSSNSDQASKNKNQKQSKSKINVKPGYKKPGGFESYINKIAIKHSGIEAALRDAGIKETPQQFIKKMLTTSVIFAVIIALAIFLLLSNFGLTMIGVVAVSVLMGFMVYQVSLNNFINYPLHRSKKETKLIDRDILFAARDMIISLRSGMPLFNAITSVSTGYGMASKEFAKIVQRVQLGSPLIETIDEVMANTKSSSFKRLMLQASISIKSGADIVSAFQSTIDELTIERQIELRRYGQKLNALSMFYMLFGIIFPSMGIAVITILTTFIAIFTVTDTVLYSVLIGIVFLQIVFIRMISSSRPVFVG